jgi:hypothetical protein
MYVDFRQKCSHTHSSQRYTGQRYGLERAGGGLCVCVSVNNLCKLVINTIKRSHPARFLPAKGTVYIEVNPCDIRCGESGIGIGFFLSFLAFLYQCFFHRCSIFNRVSFEGYTVSRLAAAVPQRHSLTPL